MVESRSCEGCGAEIPPRVGAGRPRKRCIACRPPAPLGKTARSCPDGCECGKHSRKAALIHGMAGTPEYRAWGNVKDRIFNPNCHAFADYGGRGLSMEPEWAESFAAFYAEVGPRPEPHYSIDRIDNDLGYVRGNVRWATPSEQSNNRRPNRGWYRRAA